MIKKNVITFLYTLSSIFVALGISWAILIKANFFYSYWHEYGGIKETIEYFAPKNQHISGFELTTKEQRSNAFKEINYAVHFSSKNLKDIAFTTKNKVPQLLLHKREIIHLQDVSNIINILFFLIIIFFLFWCLILIQIMKTDYPLPSIKNQALIITASLVVLSLIIIIIGATDVFYWLHEVIFPQNNQWFFYYEDSLMSTLMSAPDLFGWIALEWLVLFVVCFYILQFLTLKITRKINEVIYRQKS